MPQSQHLTDAEFNDLLVELCNPDTYDISWDGTYDFPDLEGIGNQYRPQIEPSLTTELTSPSSSGGVTQTPSSGDFDFISSPGSYQTPHMSPNSLMESPQAYFAGRDKLAPDQLNISPFNKEGFASGAPSMAPSANFDLNSPAGLYQGPNMPPNSLTGSPQVYLARPSQFTPDQINNSPYTRASVAPEAPSMASPLLSQTNRASRKRPQRVKNSPPGMKESGESAYVFSHTLLMSQPPGHWLTNASLVTYTDGHGAKLTSQSRVPHVPGTFHSNPT
jgi:hypothetical protein